MGLFYASDHVVCFGCGQLSLNESPYQYPKGCPHCTKMYDGRFQYCMPDVIIGGGKPSIIFVNGSVHQKRQKKDVKQIRELQYWGYKVFVIDNEVIDAAPNSILRAIVNSWYQAVQDDRLYSRLYTGEREVPGLGIDK